MNNIRQHVVNDQGELIKKQGSVVDKFVKPKRKPWKIALVIAAILIFAFLGYFGYKAYGTVKNIITKNNNGSAPALSFLGDVQPNQIKGEGDGRVNILIFGLGGAGHPGGELADSIMIASFSPKDKSLAMLSVPRDLYVPISGHGSGKINSAHALGVSSKDDGSGPALLKETVSKVLDIPIHYFIKVDFNGFIKLVETLGGIDVTVKKDIYDPYYPDKKMVGYDPFSISSGEHHLDGETTLKYARSRETTSDFDRARRQQETLLAIRDRLLSLNIITNPQKITEIMDIAGSHLKTDMQIWEIQRFSSIIKDLDSSKISNKVLSPDDTILTSNTNLGGYYIVPTAGIGNFSKLQDFVHSYFTDPYLTSEAATIEVINATSTSGIGNYVAQNLKSYGYDVVKITSSDKSQDKTIIEDHTDGKKPFTVQFLVNRFSADSIKQPKSSSTNADVSVIIGKDYKSE